MTNYVWCSPHTPTAEQLNDLGTVVYLKDIDKDLFNTISNLKVGDKLYSIAKALLYKFDHHTVLLQPAGSPAFQFELGKVYARGNATELPIVMYAVSERVSQDIPQPDGTIKKVSIFKHLGWQ